MAIVDASDIGYALVIPGLGHANWGDLSGGASQDWAKDKPVALLCGSEEGLNTDFILFNQLLDLKQYSTKLNPYTGVIDGGQIGAKMPATGALVYPDFLASATETLNISGIFTRRIKEAQGLLATAALTASATTIDLWSRDGNQFSEYQTIYLEDETILLTTSISVSGEVQTFNCYRGAYGSRAAFHQSLPVTGSRPDPLTGWDNRIYDEWEPFGKYVYVIERDPGALTGAKTFVIEYPADWTRTWAGWLSQEPTLSENGSVLDLPIMDVFTPFFGRSLNREPHGAEWDGQLFRAGRIFQGLTTTGTVNLTANEVTARYGAAAASSAPRVVVQIKDALVSAEFGTTTTTDPITGAHVTGFTYSFGPIIFGSEVSTVLMNSPIPDIKVTEDGQERESANEVLVGGTAMVDATGANYSCIIASAGATAGLNHHPLVCALTFIMSTGRGSNKPSTLASNYDSLSLGVGFGIPHELVDVSGIEALVVDTAELKTHGWALGYGGQSFTWGDIRSKFLVPYGYYMHPDASYNLTFSKLEPILGTIAQISASELVKFSEHERLGWNERVQSVEGTAAQPWEKGKQIVARDVAQGVQIYDPDVKDPEFKLDVSAMRPLDRRGNGEQREAVERWLEWNRRVTPVRGFTLPQNPSHSARPYVGKKYRIYIDVYVPWRGADGAPVPIGSYIYGVVTEVAHDFNTRWYDVTIACLNDQLVADPTVISSSFEIYSVINDAGANTTLRCYATQHGVDYNAETDVPYNFSWNDIEIWDRDGSVPVDLYTTGDFITAEVVSGGVTMDTGVDGAFFDLEILDPDDTMPVAGQYIRIARRSVGETKWEQQRDQTYLTNNAEIFSDGDRGKVYT